VARTRATTIATFGASSGAGAGTPLDRLDRRRRIEQVARPGAERTRRRREDATRVLPGVRPTRPNFVAGWRLRVGAPIRPPRQRPLRPHPSGSATPTSSPTTRAGGTHHARSRRASASRRAARPARSAARRDRVEGADRTGSGRPRRERHASTATSHSSSRTVKRVLATATMLVASGARLVFVAKAPRRRRVGTPRPAISRSLAHHKGEYVKVAGVKVGKTTGST